MSELAAPAGLERAPGWTRLLPDDRLVRRAAAGDEHAFAAIFDRYHQRLYRYCLAIVGRSEDAHDALQNTMVKVLRALPGEERRMELKPWLYRIAHNESIDLLRRRRDAPELDAELQDIGSNLAEEAAARERLGRLLIDLEALPERQRGALVMRELGGLDFGEISVALGTTPAVARQTLYEARLGLRQMDEGRGMSCKTVSKALSDGDGRVVRRRDIRAHLRTCADCRRFGEEIKGRKRDLAALSPLPAVAAAGLLQSLLGGAGGGGGGGLAAAAGGAANTLGGSALLKGAATVAVVAAMGVGAADRGGLIDLDAGGGGAAPPARTSDPGSGSAPGPGASDASPAASTAAGAAEVDERADVSPTAGERGSEGSGVRDARSTDPRRSQAQKNQQRGAAAGPAETPVASTAPDAASEHPHGKDHEKQHPSAAAHGQETAAAHKNGGKGSTAGKGSGKSTGSGKSAGAGKPAEAGSGQAGHPSKPVHPTHPSNPGSEKAESSPPPVAVPPVPEAEAPDPAPEADGEAPAVKETGKPPGH